MCRAKAINYVCSVIVVGLIGRLIRDRESSFDATLVYMYEIS